MNPLQAKFFELAKYSEQLKEKQEALYKELDGVMRELGYDTYHQDPETMAVYKIVKPKGRFVTFSEISYNRTALEGEKSGSLAKKEAQELGFDLVKREEF